MFMIESQLQFIRHYIGNKAVADAVAEDLMSRDACGAPEFVKVVDCEIGYWDPGGMLWVDDQHHTFDLGETQIEVYHQHLESFVSWVTHNNTQEARDWNGVKYHKIHSGYMACVCVTPDEYETLLQQISDPELPFKGSVAREERQQRLSEAGVIQVANIKDEDGNDQLVAIKPVDPVLN